ncbi:uncharacterized protein K489DRAFT_316866 [Dissoconium aciculare CBS 342.82]|uniref:Hyphal anastamosis-8 protein n=1 Tax=Dissoconium aciculare CBS 342.82 TaxID=1314786 RepID=A0A6J3MBR4_9PEZI|nr:uncharacterized protein K489DRAFT_316866 [Dissoconium aciculare CBS 342.82]KAF1824277.1 hypothetical protein K489DRAFT_316866 [Dissoconium aciculare CBS 342.82]
MSGLKKDLKVTVLPRTSEESTSSTQSHIKAPSLKSPRTARFAEATAVHSPIEPSPAALPFGREKTVHLMAQPQVSDVGFGYVNKHESVEMPDTEYRPPVVARALRSPTMPLKSAMKTPGAPPRDFGEAILSPTFKEEQIVEKTEKFTENQQVKDVVCIIASHLPTWHKVKTRVRVVKFLLRGVNFSCALVVLGMLGTTMAVFNATKALPPRNNLPAWAPNQQTWPQILLLSLACISLFTTLIVFYGYWKGGHKQAQKSSVYYTLFAVGFFIFSTVMWVIATVAFQHSKQNGNNKDMWGWACVDNPRHDLFEADVGYSLLCRLQNWSLVCAIIEIVVEVITICVYGVIFYRFYSKRQLRKTMEVRDQARSQLYMAQMRTQPNTPAPFSPRDGGWRAPSDESFNKAGAMEEGDVRYISADQKHVPAPFKLQAPPIKVTNATPKVQQLGFTPLDTSVSDRPAPRVTTVTEASIQEHVAAAPGEQVYAAVPIPGAYEAPLSPGFENRHMQFPRM